MILLRNGKNLRPAVSRASTVSVDYRYCVIQLYGRTILVKCSPYLCMYVLNMYVQLYGVDLYVYVKIDINHIHNAFHSDAHVHVILPITYNG